MGKIKGYHSKATFSSFQSICEISVRVSVSPTCVFLAWNNILLTRYSPRTIGINLVKTLTSIKSCQYNKSWQVPEQFDSGTAINDDCSGHMGDSCSKLWDLLYIRLIYRVVISFLTLLRFQGENKDVFATSCVLKVQKFESTGVWWRYPVQKCDDDLCVFVGLVF